MEKADPIGRVPKRTLCTVCGFIYDVAQGLPKDGLLPGTMWEAIPANWVCPECGAGKNNFEEIN